MLEETGIFAASLSHDYKPILTLFFFLIAFPLRQMLIEIIFFPGYHHLMKKTFLMKNAECLVTSSTCEQANLFWIDKALFKWNYMCIHLLKAQEVKSPGICIMQNRYFCEYRLMSKYKCWYSINITKSCLSVIAKWVARN